MRLRHAAILLALSVFLTTAAAASDAMDRWARDATIRIARHLRPPSEARHLRFSRVVRLRFVVDRHGRVSDPVIVAGTGSWSIDQAVVAAIVAASPLPVPPMGKGVDTVKAILPVAFDPPGIHVRPPSTGVGD